MMNSYYLNNVSIEDFRLDRIKFSDMVSIIEGSGSLNHVKFSCGFLDYFYSKGE